MKTYIGSKIINATPMSSDEFQTLVKKEKIIVGLDEPGYLVQYSDEYKSWSPKEVFENAYREITTDEIKLYTQNLEQYEEKDI